MKRVMTFALVCVLILGGYMMLPKSERVSWAWNKNDGYKMGSSPFTTTTSDSASEQAKAALKAQVDAADPGYSRNQAKKEKMTRLQVSEAWMNNTVKEKKDLFKLTSSGSIYDGTFSGYSERKVVNKPTEQPSKSQQTQTPAATLKPVSYIYFDFNNGTAIEKYTITDAGFMFEVTFVRPGYTFDGWVDENGNQVTGASPDLAGHTITAQWIKEG